MIVAYTLTMPGVNSWNGRWTGEDRLYVITRNYHRSRVPEMCKYRYSFGDGWVACVDARIVTAAEAAKLRRKSAGFYGYDWMVESIEKFGAIYAEPPRTMPAAQEVRP